MNDPIAIIGMGCRYPKADGVNALWQLLLDGGDAIEPYAAERFPELDAAYATAAAGGAGIATNLGGFLPDVDRFDTSFFGISPREAAFIDPQQRLLLEVSWHALEDAGQVREQYMGSRTGVFTGLWTTDYENQIFRNSEQPDFYLLTGGGRSTACGRISFSFGFEGPSISVDTACSSSMVAIHLACQSLRQRECDMALAGGVNVILSTDFTRLFTNAGMLAPDGHCKFGDARANGFVRSEGAGMVVLKRLADAVAAGDRIYATIRGSAVNNDGKSSGLLVTPSREGQRTMLLEAWRQAGVRGGDLSYIEAHGTGTHVGDPIEIGAIADALKAAGAKQRVAIGSMKTNLGHTESAAGVAGVIKSALVLSKGIIPASLHHQEPNPEIDWQGGNIEVVTTTRPLPQRESDRPRLAGASSFGLTGTNAHMVLEEYLPALDARVALDLAAPNRETQPSAYLLPISGHTDHALKENCRNWLDALTIEENQAALEELCWQAASRRTHLEHRYAAAGQNAAELRSQIDAFLAGQESPPASLPASPRVVFVSPGQGSQWDGMARDLLRESPVFRTSFEASDQAVANETGWSLIQRLESVEASQYLAEIDFVQPALFAMSVALAAVWNAAGVKADAVVGHSMGEVAAAYLVGALSLADAAAVICRRSRLMRSLSGAGAMASVDLPIAELTPWLEQFAGSISIAAENSPGTTVLSGESDAIDQLLDWLELKEIFSRRIKVDVASHSQMVDPILDELAWQLRDLNPSFTSQAFFSTVDGKLVEGKTLDARYWIRNLREPVRLAPTVTALADSGYTCFVELSPHPILAPALEATLRDVKPTAAGAACVLPSIVLSSMLRGKPAWATLLGSLGRYWSFGGRLDWNSLAGRQNSSIPPRLQLPQYAFERERFWPEASSAKSSQVVAHHRQQLGPLLESRIDPASELGTTIFSVTADLPLLSYLADHRVAGAIVFPASAHIEAVLEASRILHPAKTVELSDLNFHQALYLSATDGPELQLVIRRVPGQGQVSRFSLMSRQSRDMGEWVVHSTGVITGVSETASSLAEQGRASSPFEPVDSLGMRSGTGEEHYRRARRSGLEYGAAFQLLESYRSGSSSGRPAAETRIRFDDPAREPSYVLHPALLDACFQAMIPLRPRIPGMPVNDLYLPHSIGRLRVLESPSSPLSAKSPYLITEAVLTGVDGEAGSMEFELQLKTGGGQTLVIVEAMTVQRVKTRSGDDVVDDLFQMHWKPLATVASATPGGSAGKHWLIFADGATIGSDGRSERNDPRNEYSLAAQLASRHATLAGRSTLVWPGERFRALGAGERRLDLLGADEYELPFDDSDALDSLLRLVAAEAGRISDVIDLWTVADQINETAQGTDPQTLAQILDAQAAGTKFIPVLTQAISRAAWINPPRLWLVTRGTQNIAHDQAPGLRMDTREAFSLAGSTVWGLGAAVAREMPELHPALIDLSECPEPGEIQTLAALIAHVPGSSNQAVGEDRLALRKGQIYAGRLIPCASHFEPATQRRLAPGEAFRIETGQPGAVDQLHLRAMVDQPVGPGEVQIEVSFAGLNFIDVTKALGIYPGLDPKAAIQMGGECSGRISAIGAGVTDFQVGDEVVALTSSPTRVGLLASRVVLPSAFVMRKPETISTAEAAALPIAHLTAHYSLNDLARLEPGEWILIHAGAGGVGLAAISIAQALGARVIATASSPEKHAFLRSWGVEHVLQSRTLDFSEQVMVITQGCGVDVVLNSLSGEFLLKSLEVLAAYGRFVELGKRDIYEDRPVGLKAFRKNIRYFAVDLAALLEDRPSQATRLLGEVMAAVGSGKWRLPPVKTFSAADPAAAFQFMAEAGQIGKLVLDFTALNQKVAELQTQDLTVDWQVYPPHRPTPASLFKRNASYILTGGLGGVGVAVAEWMAQNGAGHLVLVSRRSAGEAELALFRRIEALGTKVTHRQTDLLDAEATHQLVREIVQNRPGRSGQGARMPLCGILHAAAVIDDALISELRPERFDPVFGPKISGTWNLHQATLSVPLDFFVMFSSFASIFPQPGHGSYSAANSFMDAFAGYRRSLGLPASSINWAGWLSLGLAREAGTSRTIEAYEREGFGSFARDEALNLLGKALLANPVQASAVRVDPDILSQAFESLPPLFHELVDSTDFTGRTGQAGAASTVAHPHLHTLQQAASVDERLSHLQNLLRTEVSRVLKLAPERIPSRQPFGQMGIDSLMALELIRRVNGALGLALPATAVFNYPTLTALTGQILKRLGLDTAVEKREFAGNSQPPAALPHVTGMSDEEAMRALMESGDFLGGY